jgi:hypothetical protein
VNGHDVNRHDWNGHDWNGHDGNGHVHFNFYADVDDYHSDVDHEDYYLACGPINHLDTIPGQDWQDPEVMGEVFLNVLMK